MRAYIENQEGFTRTLFEGDKPEVKAFLKGVKIGTEARITNQSVEDGFMAGFYFGQTYHDESQAIVKGISFGLTQADLLAKGYTIKVGE